MKKMLAAFAFAALVLAGCAPGADRPSLKPTIFKLGAPVAVGQALTIQGRYLGGAKNSQVIFNADELGNNGIEAQAGDVVSWNSSEIVVKVPAATRPTGRFLFVRVGGVLSNGMPWTASQ